MEQKIPYFIEDAINNVSKKLNLGLGDANQMSDLELDRAERIISEYVDFVEHPSYEQLVPKVKETGELVLP